MPFTLNDPTQTSIEIHVGDIGTQVILTIYDQSESPVNLTGNTSLTMRFEKPDNTTFDRTASIYGLATGGKIVYTLIEGDIDISGTWKYQGIIEFPTGLWHTNKVEFTVYDNIDEPIIP